MGRVLGIVTIMAIALAGIYLFNRFSGKNVATLGAGGAAS